MMNVSHGEVILLTFKVISITVTRLKDKKKFRITYHIKGTITVNISDHVHKVAMLFQQN